MLAADSYGARESTYSLEIRRVFESLSKDERKENGSYTAYAHHLARACWYGTRIILRQTSPEAEGIFDFILELHRACGGRWDSFRDHSVKQEDLDAWLEFAGMFMSNLGNYFNDGNHKAVPDVPEDALRNMASISPEATAQLHEIFHPMIATQPSRLGYPSETCQSSFYPGKERITKQEIEAVTNMIEEKGIGAENTRLQKQPRGDDNVDIFHVLQASAEKDPAPQLVGEITIGNQGQAKIFLCRGDHSREMEKICSELVEARKNASTAEQQIELLHLIECFRTGEYKTAFWAALKAWVKDKNPRVEHSLGWLSSYRDPHNARTDWQSSVGITDVEEVKKMRQLLEQTKEIIRTLPWAEPSVNGGISPFERTDLDAPDFAIIHVLGFACNTFWEATNTNLNNEDGANYGAKTIIYGNRMSLNNRPGRPCYYVNPSEADEYMSYAHIIRFNGTAIHELIGHGSAKLLAEPTPGKFNFDHDHPPLSPVTGRPIESWYRPKETWGSVFGSLAMTIEECRAFLFAYYLADNKDILAMFGYSDHSVPTADDLIYYTYLHLGVEGLRALRSFKADDQAWGGDHDRALFAILRHLIQDGDGVLGIEHNAAEKQLFVRVDRSKLITHGKPSIGRMLCKIHIWRCTADIEACRPFYETLSTVDGEFEIWRQIVVSNPEPKWKFVQPNTFVKENGTVELREYDATNEGIIQSFYERNV